MKDTGFNKARLDSSFPIDLIRSCPNCGDCWTSSVLDEAIRCTHCGSEESEVDHISLEKPDDGKIGLASPSEADRWDMTYPWLRSMLNQSGWTTLAESNDEVVLSSDGSKVDIGDINLYYAGDHNYFDQLRTYQGYIVEVDDERIVEWRRVYDWPPATRPRSMSHLMEELLALEEALFWGSALQALLGQMSGDELDPSFTVIGDTESLELALKHNDKFGNEEVKRSLKDVSTLMSKLRVETDHMNYTSNPAYDLIHL